MHKKQKPKAARKAAKTTNALGAGGARNRVAPVASGKSEMSREPRITQMTRGGDTRVVHREYIGDIVSSSSSTGFVVLLSQPINPGQVQTFPWLSAIAQRFESYRFRKLKFCYETEAPTSLPGSSILTVDYDANDPAPVSKQSAMSYAGAVRSPPWADSCHVSRAENLNKQKSYFVRPGALPAGGTLTQYDVGNLFVCSSGVTESSAMGELYVEYDIDLMTPVYESVPSAGSLAGYPANAISSAALFGTSPLVAGNVGISVVGDVVTVKNLTPGASYYGLFVELDSGATSVPSVGTFVGTSASATTVALTESNTGTSLWFTFTAIGSTVTFTLAQATVTTPSASYLRVWQYS